MTTLSNLIQNAIYILREAGIDEYKNEARILAEWATNTTRLDALTQPEKLITEEMNARISQALKQRISGMPVYRILGAREFYGLPFQLSKETLEPRDDTEALIDLVLPILQNLKKVRFLDMGTGSGIIAITLLKYAQKATAVAVDISEDALITATKNAALNNVKDRFTALESDWFDKVEGLFNFIVSNPPYIPHEDLVHLQKEVRDFDPIRALDGGMDGLNFYRALANKAKNFLYENGFVAVEIGIRQSKDVTDIFAAHGFSLLEMSKDLGNIERALLFRLT